MTEDHDYEQLKNSILSLNSINKVKSILLTSAGSGEGCSTVASNLADHLARNTALKICLIDCTSTQKLPQNYLEMTNNPESKELIVSKLPADAVLNRTHYQNLSILTSRKDNGNPLAIFESHKLSGLVELNEEFDFLIFDYSPINRYPDISILASLVDGVIIVIHAGKTRREVAQKTKEQLQMARANILGVVLNRTVHFIPDFIYKWL